MTSGWTRTFNKPAPASSGCWLRWSNSLRSAWTRPTPQIFDARPCWPSSSSRTWGPRRGSWRPAAIRWCRVDGRPAVPYGLRGLLGARLLLRTGASDAHSGLTGGAARNPLAELCALVYACVDARTGRVKIPGFYDDVVPPTQAEIKSFLASGFQVNRFMRAYGFRTLRTTNPADVLRRIWASPTFEVHGLVGGYTGPGVKTAVPGHGELKISMRLVPNQRPEKIFASLRRFVARQNPNVTVEREGMLQPFRGVFKGPYADAIRDAVRAGFGKDPAFIREGGSIGAVATMQRAWRVPILLLGLSLPEHGYHAPNEYFDWGQASGGMKAFAHYFTELAKLGKRVAGSE